MFPVYCITCGLHIPKLVSDTNKGLCPDCFARSQPAHTPLPPPPQQQPPLIAPPSPGSPNYQQQPGQYAPATKKSNGGLIALLVVAGFCGFCLLGSLINGNRNKGDETSPSEPAVTTPSPQKEAYDKKRAEDQAKAAEEARLLAAEEAVRGKKPVPSAWDGITPEANEWLRQNLRDYESMKLVECSVIIGYGDDAWAQRVKYRAQNGFGGMNLEERLFVMRNGRVIDVISL